MLKFLVQTFYPPLFSHSFPFSNFPLAILFPSVILFPFKSFPYQKAQSKRNKLKPPKTSYPPKEVLLQTAANRMVQRLLGRGVTF
jgi:hypothetical protein